MNAEQGWKTVIGGCPLDCPDTCSWVVTVDEHGKAVKLRGNPEHPFTQGGLCPKVNPWLEHAADPSRLLHPMRRVGAKGQGRFTPISWDDAIDEMAERFTEIIDRTGGAAIWPYVGTGNLGFIQGSKGPGRVWTRMGASAHHLSICSVSGKEGVEYSIGTGAWIDAEDFAQAGLVVVWGSNTLVTNRHLWPFIETARDAGAKLVVVDPLRTRTAERADTHLALRPGTDGALALGLCQAIVEAGGADEAFLTERCLGWDEFRTSLEAWDLERTASITGVDEAAIVKLAQAMIDAPPLALRIGHGIQRHASGGQAMRVVSCLPAMVGAYDHRGGGALYSSTGTPKGMNVKKAYRRELGRRPRTLTMTNLGHNLTALDDPPVEALVIWGANPLVSNPETELVRRGMERTDLYTVVIDLYPTETTAYADLILPSTMQHEQFELNDSYNHRYLNWNQPAVAPAGECLPHTEIFRRLATAMGYDEPELFASDEEIAADLLDSPELRADGVTMDALRQRGFARWTPPHARTPDDHPADSPFPTDSGRIEFTSTRAEQEGHGLLPNYRPPAEAASDHLGGLALIAAASEHHVNSTFAGTAATLAKTEKPPLFLHPIDAAERSLTDGDAVEVGNEHGSFEALVIVSDHTRPGTAATTKGWWGHGLNNTVVERDNDMSKGPTFHDNRIEVTGVR